MDRLPVEVLGLVLDYCIASHYLDKNRLLALRTVCRAFDGLIRPAALRTLGLDYTRLHRGSREKRPPNEAALQRIGNLCHALFLDLILVREEGELFHMCNVLAKTSKAAFADELRRQRCLGEDMFTELDYRQHLGNLLEHCPNATAVRLNLPFPLALGDTTTSTMLLGNTIEALAQRPEESLPLRTLVVNYLADASIVKLWTNPRDVANIIQVFASLDHLVLEVRQHEIHIARTGLYYYRLWEMISKARGLTSLCFITMDMEKSPDYPVKTRREADIQFHVWQSRDLPTIPEEIRPSIPPLVSLELCRVSVYGTSLMRTLEAFLGSLRELYLDDVFLKIIPQAGFAGDINYALWVGEPNERRGERHTWIAVALREARHNLRVFRATNLGYDQYDLENEHVRVDPMARYDLDDPCGLSRGLGRRFVEVLGGVRQPNAPDGSPVIYLPIEEEQTWALADKDRWDMEPDGWDTWAYWAKHSNTTSAWRTAIDRQFLNCNPTALGQLDWIASEARKGIDEANKLAELARVDGQRGDAGTANTAWTNEQNDEA